MAPTYTQMKHETINGIMAMYRVLLRSLTISARQQQWRVATVIRLVQRRSLRGVKKRTSILRWMLDASKIKTYVSANKSVQDQPKNTTCRRPLVRPFTSSTCSLTQS